MMVKIMPQCKRRDHRKWQSHSHLPIEEFDRQINDIERERQENWDAKRDWARMFRQAPDAIEDR